MATVPRMTTTSPAGPDESTKRLLPWLVAVAFFMQHPGLSPEWRLLIITGFLGGLTTFSTFSAETVTLLARGQYAWSMAIITAHLGGSLLMTVLGMQTIKWVQQ